MAKSRVNIPQQHREIMRCNVRFDRRDTRDMRLHKHLSNPESRSRRIKELLELGFEALENFRSLWAGQTTNPPTGGDQ